MRVFLCVLFVSAVGCSHSAAYRQSGEAEDFRLAMAYEIKPGMTMQAVRSRLGEGEVPSDDRRADLSRVIPKFAARGGYYPQGVEADDQFVQYRYNTNTSEYLQFRDDKLINFDPVFYEDPEACTFYAVIPPREESRE